MKNVFFWIILACSFFLLLITSFRGIVYHDEGYIVYAASRILDGQVIYRDFHFAYTPGSVYLTAFFFKLFGQSIFVERIIVVIMTLLSSLLISILCKQTLVKSKVPAAGSHLLLLLPFLIFISWGPMHTNFVWPVMVSIITGLASCYAYLKGSAERKQNYLILAGILTFLTILSKQNFGIGLLGVLCIAIVLQRNLRMFSCYVLGLFISSVVFLLSLYQTQSLIPFWDDFTTYTIQRIVLEQSLNTPFFYGTTLLEKIAKALLYLFPAYTALAALWLTYKQKSPFIILPFFCLVYYILGIRPTTDYNHLAPLIALSGIPLIIIIRNSTSKLIQGTILAVAFVMILFGFSTAFFKGYYQWQMPLYQNTVFVDNPRIRIWLNPQEAAAMKELAATAKVHAPSSEYIFVDAYAPMVYFVTNKKNPTKFDLLSFNQYYINNQKMIIKTLEHHKVPFIVAANDLTSDTSPLGKYIRSTYRGKPAVQDFFYFYRENSN